MYNLHAWGEGDIEGVFGKLSLLEVEEINKYIKDKQKLFSEIIEKIKLLENQIDTKVYGLYELTPEEIQIIKERFPSDYRIENDSE